MSKWTKEQLECMLEDVVNEIELSDSMVENHGPLGTSPAELVRLVLDQKNMEISMLKNGIIPIEPRVCQDCGSTGTHFCIGKKPNPLEAVK